MIWSSWSEFAAMGGYGLYVWASFGGTAVLLGGELIALRLRQRALLRRHRSDPADHAGIGRGANFARARDEA